MRARVRVKDRDDALGTITLNAAIYTDALAQILGTPSIVASATITYSGYVTLSTPTGGWDWTKSDRQKAE